MPEPVENTSDLGTTSGNTCAAPEPLSAESIFLSEWLAGNRPPNQLPVSAVCNSHCIFCSNRLNPFPVATGIFRDMADIKLQLSLMPAHRDPIRMSDSLPGRIAEGEAFLHPKFFDILSLVRHKFIGNTLCFTTNASMLDEAFLKKLAGYRPMEITVSLHSTQPEVWARIFRKSEKDAHTALQALDLIRKYRMELKGTIVPLPAICGWEDIEKTYSTFIEHGATSMIMYWPGYTVCSQPDVVQDVACSLDEFSGFAEKMRERYKVPLFAFPEMKAPLALPVKRIMALTLRGNGKTLGGPFRKVLWLASEAAYERLQAMVAHHAPSFPNQHHVIPVPNRTYGGNIMVAGLLMVQDFIEAGKKALEGWPGAELILVPRTPFDWLSRDLQRRPAHGIRDALGIPVWLVNEMGAVDPLLDRLFFRETASGFAPLQEAMNRFNTVFQDDKVLDGSLDLIDAYPVRTSWGDLAREDMKGRLLTERQRMPPGVRPLFQGFEMLGASRGLCIERWPTKDEVITYRKWTFLVKREGGWRIQEIVHGDDEDMIRGEPAEER
jgi:wyosine [tRNA(Phe)-imidazoG37] synthetase (radical SAM superfamily)